MAAPEPLFVRMVTTINASSVQGVRSSGRGPAGVRVAILDDDSGFLRVLGKRLDAAGWQCQVLGSPAPVEALVTMRLNALVLDLALLDAQGWSYLETLCLQLPHLCVVVCTGRSSVAQRVRGLRLGADDWITKPCHPEELIARLEAGVRRRKRAAAPAERAPVVVGQVEIHPDQFQALIGGSPVELTRREFELLQLLVEARGQVMERQDIYQRVWGYAMARGDRSVDVFVRKLRRKLEQASPGWRYIHTHFGIGYRFAAEPVHSAGDDGAVASLPSRGERLRSDAPDAIAHVERSPAVGRRAVAVGGLA